MTKRNLDEVAPIIKSVNAALGREEYNYAPQIMDEIIVTPTKNIHDVRSKQNMKPVNKTEEQRKQLRKNMQKGQEAVANAIFDALEYIPVDPIGPIGKIIHNNVKHGIKTLKTTFDDYRYVKAIKNIHPQEVKYLRKKHFANAAKHTKTIDVNGNPITTYHTVKDNYNSDFTEFNPNIEGTNSAIYTADSDIMSGSYSDKLLTEKERDYYIDKIIKNELALINAKCYTEDLAAIKKSILSNKTRARKWALDKVNWLNGKVDASRQKRFYVNLENPVVIDGAGTNWSNLPSHLLPKDVYDNLHFSSMDFGFTTRDIEKAQKAVGKYDGAIIKDITDFGGSKKSILSNSQPSTVFQVNKPENLKLADAITRDNDGKLILLSKRDNFKIKDFRYKYGGIVNTNK